MDNVSLTLEKHCSKCALLPRSLYMSCVSLTRHGGPTSMDLGGRICVFLATHTSKRTNILTTTYTPQAQFG